METEPRQPGDGFADLDGMRIAFEVRGSGSGALVFIHGASADRTHWFHQMKGLALERRRVAIDLPGHGASDEPLRGHSLDLHARALAAVLDELGVERAVFVGHSNGALVARQFLRRYPKRTEALVLVDGSLKPTLSTAVIEWMRAALERPDCEDMLASMFKMSPKGKLAEEDLARIEAAFACSRATMSGWLDVLSDESTWAEDPIGVPLLVLNASTPPQGTDEYDEFVRGLAPEAQIQRWSDVSHFLMMERPLEFNRLLESFVAEL